MNSVTKFIRQQKVLSYRVKKRSGLKVIHKKVQRSFLDKLSDSIKGCNYQTFLKSEYWSEVRKLIFKRDGNKCTICKSDNNLHVHHDSYAHHFKEHLYLNDLMLICGSCHKDYHYNIEIKE